MKNIKRNITILFVSLATLGTLLFMTTVGIFAGAAQPIKIDAKLYYNYPLSSFDEEFDLRAGSLNHPNNRSVSIGKNAENGTQYGIHIYQDNTYGSVKSDITLNLENGTIKVSKNMGKSFSSNSPIEGSNYFEYVNALSEMVSVINEVKQGYTNIPYIAPPRPELGESVSYIKSIIEQLKTSSTESVYMSSDRPVKPAGSYNLQVNYKTEQPREVLIEFKNDGKVVTTGKVSVDKNLSTVSVGLDIPKDAAQTNDSSFEVKLLPSDGSSEAISEFTQKVTVNKSNTIDTLLTNSNPFSIGKDYKFIVGCSAIEESVLRILVEDPRDSTKVFIDKEYTAKAGDDVRQDIIINVPAEVANCSADYVRVKVMLLSKDKQTLNETFMYTGIE